MRVGVKYRSEQNQHLQALAAKAIGGCNEGHRVLLKTAGKKHDH